MLSLKALHCQPGIICWPLCPGFFVASERSVIHACSLFPQVFLWMDRGPTFFSLNSLELTHFSLPPVLFMHPQWTPPPRYPWLPLPPTTCPTSFHSAPFYRSSNLLPDAHCPEAPSPGQSSASVSLPLEMFSHYSLSSLCSLSPWPHWPLLAPLGPLPLYRLPLLWRAPLYRPSYCWAELYCASLHINTCAVWMDRASAVQCDKGDLPTNSVPQQSVYSSCHIPSRRWQTQHCVIQTVVPQPWPVLSSSELVWTGPSWTFPESSTMKPGELNWLKTVFCFWVFFGLFWGGFFFFFLMTNSYLNLLQLVNMCILNFSEKRNLRKKNPLVLSCLNFSLGIFVCFCLFFLCIDYYQGITVQRNDMVSVYLSLTWFQSKKKKYYNLYNGGLVVCDYDGISVLLKRFTSLTFSFIGFSNENKN